VIDLAWAGSGGGGGAQGGMGEMLFPLMLIFVIMYFLMIRPQQKKQKAKRAMISALSKGDRIRTIGGIHGKVTQVKDSTITLQVASQTRLEIARSAVSAVLSDGDDGDTDVKDEEALQEQN